MIGHLIIRNLGELAPEIPLENQRPAQCVFSEQVQIRLSDIRAAEAKEKAAKVAANANGGVPTLIPAE